MSKQKKLDPAFLTSLYKEMLFYRRFEEKVLQAYTKQKFAGFCHLHIGQEALCVGVQSCLQPDDYMISGYRSHTQAIAKGIEAKRVFAELFGKVEGCSRGKGGSMHMFSKEKRFFGGHGIVGGQAPIALGVGFAIKYRKEKSIMVCYLGDAAMNQGQVFEAMNMAATWNLPVLFIVENNKYGMGTAINRTTSVDFLYKRALAFDMLHGEVDGMNVMKVHEEVSRIVKQMRADSKPYLLEAHTYRYKGHSVSDPGTYRSKEEVEAYAKKDPILQHGQLLQKEGICKEKDLEKFDEEAKNQVREAEAFADEAPIPDVAEVWQHVFQEN